MRPPRAPLALLLGLVLFGAAALAARAAPAEEEVRLGREYSRRLEAQYKVITDRAVVERVTRVGAEVAAAADRELPYAFKVLEIDAPNAVSLPGGFVYLTKGMLGFVRSDHELAAVMAHEVAHAAHRHQMELIRRNNQVVFWTFLVALVTGDPNLASAAHLIGGGLLSGYTREMERDADLTAIAYLAKTAYTPVAMLTVMERVLRAERYTVQPDPGAFRDHPRTEERVAYLTEELRRRGIPLRRRAAMDYLRVSTRTVTEQNRPVGEVLVNETVVLRLADPARAQAAAERLNRYFDTDPPLFELTFRRVEGGWGIFGGPWLLITITPADAALLGASLEDAAVQVTARLRWVIEQDQRQRRLTG